MRVRARVRLTIEIASNDVWPIDVTVARVYAQASEAAMRDVQKCIQEWDTRIKLVEKPVVTAILAEEERD